MGDGSLRVGEIVGDYEVEAPLQLEDAQGRYYEARHRLLGSRLVLKVLRVSEDPEVRAEQTARFERGARALARLKHPNALRIQDFGLIRGRHPFMVQAWWEGHTLRETLSRQGALSPSRALLLLDGCLQMLGEAHASGIVNRGLSPDTLILLDPETPREKLVVLSFDAAFVDWDQTRHTLTGSLMGDPVYLAPEYIEHGEMTPMLDVYQMGLVLTEMLTGEPATGTRDPTKCAIAHLKGDLSVPDALRQGALGAVLQKALALSPEARYPNARAFAEALSKVNPASIAMQSMPKEVKKGVEPGDVLAGRFVIKGFLGQGGFAMVYEGEHSHTGQSVAIKVMHPRPGKQEQAAFTKRFLREAKAAAALEHPNIVSVIHCGTLDDGTPYMVMEKLDGHDLEEVLVREGPLVPTRVLPIFCDCLEALGEAHAKGIVHKDLKPSNLFLSHAGKAWELIKVLDFGIARMGEGEEARLTQTGQVFFTPQYGAPEYIERQEASPATDVYQMGLVLVELLTGESVVKGEMLSCMMAHVSGKLDIPESCQEGPLGEVVRKATHKNPEDRYTDGAAFAEALRRVPLEAVSHRTATIASEGTMDISHIFARLEFTYHSQPRNLAALKSLASFCARQGGWPSSGREWTALEHILSHIEGLTDTESDRALILELQSFVKKGQGY